LQEDITNKIDLDFSSLEHKKGYLKCTYPFYDEIYLDTAGILTFAHRDEIDKQINLSQHRLMNLIQKSANRNKILHFALLECSKHPNNIVLWKDLVASFPELTIQTSSFTGDGCIYEYEGYSYEPEIFLANAEWVNLNLAPILSDGISFADDVANQNHDLIIGFYENNSTPIVMGESSFLNITNPVMVMSLSVCGPTNTHNTGTADAIVNEGDKNYGKEHLPQAMQRNSPGTASFEFRLNHRFESNSHSEWHLVYFENKANGPNPSTLKIGHERLANVHKDDIGKDLSKWIFWTPLMPLGVCPPAGPLPETFGFGYNTYECDRFQSKKDLGQTQMGVVGAQSCVYNFPPSFIQDGRPIAVNVVSSGLGAYGGNRKFFTDWYSFGPDIAPAPGSQAMLNYMRIPYFFDQCWGEGYWKHTQQFQDNRGYVSFWRVGGQ
jgi:hypothetical protein